MRRLIRESTFNLARRDLALFLEEYEEELLQVFREEIQRVDDEIPEEKIFIDLKMATLGEVFLKAGLKALCRFLRDDIPRPWNP